MGLHFYVVPLLLLSLFLAQSPAFAQTTSESNNVTLQSQEPAIQVTANTEGKLQTITIPKSKLLFDLSPKFDANGNLLNFGISLKPELMDFYKQVGPSSESNAVFVYPIFTQAAYGKNGFYDYYNGKCDSSCLTVPIPPPAGHYSSSGIGTLVLTRLGYSFVTDVDVDKNPYILKQYEKVIMMHNEYVTKNEFDAITSHPNVVFLYPNALYAQVNADYSSNTITLVRGHGYPDKSIKNGFDWQFDNSKYEYDSLCSDWTFYQQKGYTFLDCYPEYKVLYGSELLRAMGSSDPTSLYQDLSNWIRYSDKNSTEELLDDYDIKGNYVPSWVQNTAIWVLNGQVAKDEFGNLLLYLVQNKIIQNK